MTSPDHVTAEELKALRQRAGQLRVHYLVHIGKAILATAKAMVSGAAPGGFRAAQ